MGSRRAVAIAPLLLGLALAACSSQEPTVGSEERFARRFMLPIPRPWRPESTLPPEPQKEPKMVIWEVSQYPPGAKPTPEQRAAAVDLLKRSEAAAIAMDWENFEKARADGFKLMRGDRRHYYNKEFILDDRVLDPERPEFLMYYDAPEGKRLVGYMFYARTPTGPGPQIGGPLTVWHYHVWNYTACLLQGLVPGGRRSDRVDQRACPVGFVSTHRSPEMIHVWLIDRPRGRFATSMHLPPDAVREQLAKRDRALRRTRTEGTLEREQ
ncbi:MAG: hypothetical protein V3T07_06270 [Myxococcota bacterium]